MTYLGKLLTFLDLDVDVLGLETYVEKEVLDTCVDINTYLECIK